MIEIYKQGDLSFLDYKNVTQLGEQVQNMPSLNILYLDVIIVEKSSIVC